MCGIAGVVALNEKGRSALPGIQEALACLKKRGPDADGIYTHGNVAMAHTRLSIIDTSDSGAQPMTDPSGRYTLIFNGEFFNYLEHRKGLLDKGVVLRSHSDTEVLLHLYILEGENCLRHVNGFFSLAIYDREEESIFLARDRMGIKPFLYYADENTFLFASEMKALMAMGIPRVIDRTSLYSYFQLNYIPEPYSILEGVKKLSPGHFLKISKGGNDLREKQYYAIPYDEKKDDAVYTGGSYQQAQKKLFELLDASVQRRLISDVPLGAFLSGGLDSSVIVALAARHTQQLKTFSIGFKDEPYFDETYYANLVAEKYKTDHTAFNLSTADLLNDLFPALDYLDEPFADSSALAVHILSRETRKHVTVALSGDGADELFGGYNKHRAEYNARHAGFKHRMISLGYPLWKILPQSRNSKYGNLFRQLDRFADGMHKSPAQRYWRWASVATQDEASRLLGIIPLDKQEFESRQAGLLQHINGKYSLNDVLVTDMKLVLPGDMLRKVDSMSMANSLEVRVPLLDYKVVDFAFSLPSSFKITSAGRKVILRETFAHLLPRELVMRRKQGFEIPLHRWFNNELKSLLTNDLLEDNFIREQNLFAPAEVKHIKSKLFSSNPGEAAAKAWALLAFQYWWKKYFIS